MKEQAAGVWETCLAPGWPQLRSGLPFGPRSQASLQKAQGPGVCKLPKTPASRALCQAKRAPILPCSPREHLAQKGTVIETAGLGFTHVNPHIGF